MAQVTHGLVSVEDGKKAAEEYAPARKVRVDLGFSVGEGEDFQSIFDTVSQAAVNRVAALLGTSALQVVGGTEAAPAGTRVRRTKAQIAADEAAAAAGAKVEDPTGGEESVIHLTDASAVEDPSAVGEPGAPTTGGAGDAQTSGDASDMSEFDIPGEPLVVDPITDADLNSAVQKKNGELGAPNLIRELIGSYNPDPTKPFQLRQIPADKRPEFMHKLGELKKPAA